jgi:hypothetical protein
MKPATAAALTPALAWSDVSDVMWLASVHQGNNHTFVLLHQLLYIVALMRTTMDELCSKPRISQDNIAWAAGIAL